MDKALCLDGPLNGQYADYNNPPEGYEADVWPNGESILIHAHTPIPVLPRVVDLIPNSVEEWWDENVE